MISSEESEEQQMVTTGEALMDPRGCLFLGSTFVQNPATAERLSALLPPEQARWESSSS